VAAIEDSTVNVKQLFDLSGRVAIITGGSIGLGRQMAEGMAEMGADVVLCARKQERCHQAAQEFELLNVNAMAIACDVKSQTSVQEMVQATLAKFGRIDILLNNAGISWGAAVENMRLEDWTKVIETNLTGTFLCAKAAGEVMIRQGQGKIINIASVAGLGGPPRNSRQSAITPAREELLPSRKT
jgi:gluconate 5-dehydrogenase